MGFAGQRCAALEARIQKQMQATGFRNVEEVLLRLVETQEEQDRWLLENRDANDTKIRLGIEGDWRPNVVRIAPRSNFQYHWHDQRPLLGLLRDVAFQICADFFFDHAIVCFFFGAGHI